VPLIEINALTPGDADVAEILRRLNAAVAETLGCRPDAVWTTWRPLDAGYAVGDEVAMGGTAPSTHPPLVHVYINRTPEQIDAVCETIASVLGPEAFITVQPVFDPG
jgi:hypothetical protein